MRGADPDKSIPVDFVEAALHTLQTARYEAHNGLLYLALTFAVLLQPAKQVSCMHRKAVITSLERRLG